MPLTPTPARGDQPALVADTAAGYAALYLHGATLAEHHPAGLDQPLLWCSDHAVFNAAKPIRGGVPICFPWFGPHADDPGAPSHGLVRQRAWELVAANATSHDGLTAELQTRTDHWQCRYDVQAGRDLRLRFTATNTTDAPRSFELALHTYLAVSDIHDVAVAGLEDTDYLDNLQNRARKMQEAEPLRFTGETDRVYVNTDADVVIHDPGWHRKVTVSKAGAKSTVVWNPWPEKASRMADLGDDEWPRFVCVESGCIADNAVSVAPGAEHTVTVKIGAQPLD